MGEADEAALYDATLVVTYPGEDITDADETLESILDKIEEWGFEVTSSKLEESVKLEED